MPRSKSTIRIRIANWAYGLGPVHLGILVSVLVLIPWVVISLGFALVFQMHVVAGVIVAVIPYLFVLEPYGRLVEWFFRPS